MQAGNESPAIGGLPLPLHQSSTHPRSPEPRADMLSRKGIPQGEGRLHQESGSDDLELLQESGGGSVRHERECALPAGRGRADIVMASCQTVCISSDQDTVTGVIQDHGGASFSDTHPPELAEPALVPRSDRTAGGTTLADPHLEGCTIPGEWLSVATEPGVVKPSCVAASGISERLSTLHSRVLDTHSEARALSTRHLYALKWGVFVKWCGQAHNDLSTCTVSDVLSFLQYRLDSGSLPSTLKVYVAAIALFHFPQGGQSIDRHTLVVSFLKWSEKIASPTFQDRFTVCPVFQVISLV